MKPHILSLIALFLGTNSILSDTKLDREVIAKKPKEGVVYALPINKQKLGFTRTNGSRYNIPIQISEGKAIKITIEHGYDDSGDNGMTWRLVDAISKRTLAKGFTKSKKSQSWIIQRITSSNPILILEDRDSNFAGRHPGNGFTISVKVSK